MAVGVSAAADPSETPAKTGGSIYFETTPPGATIFLDGVNIGTSPFTYAVAKNGTMKIRVQKKLYRDYLGVITLHDGERVTFRALLTEAPSETPAEATPEPVTTATIIEKAPSIIIPTPWPETTTESPVSPVTGIVAAALCAGLVVLGRR